MKTIEKPQTHPCLSEDISGRDTKEQPEIEFILGPSNWEKAHQLLVFIKRNRLMAVFFCRSSNTKFNTPSTKFCWTKNF